MGTHALPDIYTLSLGPMAVCIYKAKHSCPWYNYYIYNALFEFIYGLMKTVKRASKESNLAIAQGSSSNSDFSVETSWS